MKNKYLSLREIQLAELDILLAFDSFCKENNLKYSLAYGTLLGAVRHKGFIPWDDDVDVAMPRDDYNKLVQLYDNNKQSRYKLYSGLTRNLPVEISKFFDTFIRCTNKFIIKGMDDLYLWLDVFPFDHSPNNDKESLKLSKKFNHYKFLCINKKHSYRNIFLNCIDFIHCLPYKFVNMDKALNNTEKFIDSLDKNTNYYQNFVFSSDGNNDKIRKESFEKDMVFMEFEGHKFPCFHNYDEILTKLYGDYMKFPSKKKIKSKNHAIRAWLLPPPISFQKVNLGEIKYYDKNLCSLS